MNIYEGVYKTYKQFCEELAQDIEDDMPDDGPIDGREWCNENDVPEQMFADAVSMGTDTFDYGVTPMMPWRIEE